MYSDGNTDLSDKLEVSPDKAYEMEFLFAREEIRARMDYNRRLMAGQITLIAAIIAAALSAYSKIIVFIPAVLQAMAATIIWLNGAFVFENTANNSHISAAAVFMHNVLNSKYYTGDNSNKIYEWEAFLSLERQHSRNVLKRNFFIIDASFVLNVMLTVMAMCCYYVSLRVFGMKLSRMALAGFLTGVALVSIAYWGHFNSNASWRKLVSKEEAGRLRFHYAVQAGSTFYKEKDQADTNQVGNSS